MGKGEIARYEQFLLFPQRFQKTCTADTQKPGLAWERVNPFPNKPLLYPLQNECFRGYTGISVSVCVSVCVQNISFFPSAGGCIKLHLVTALYFMCLLNKSLKTLSKVEIARNSNFSFSHSVLLPNWRYLCHFQQFHSSRLQTLSVWRRLKFVVWERNSPFSNHKFWTFPNLKQQCGPVWRNDKMYVS